MNELQLGLMGAGAVIVVGVVIYNGLQGRRARRRLPRTMTERDEALAPSPMDEQEEPPFIQPTVAPLRREPAAARAPVHGDGAAAHASGERDEATGLTADLAVSSTFGAASRPMAAEAVQAAPIGSNPAGGAAKASSSGHFGDRREPTFGTSTDLTAPSDVPADLASVERAGGAEPVLNDAPLEVGEVSPTAGDDDGALAQDEVAIAHAGEARPQADDAAGAADAKREPTLIGADAAGRGASTVSSLPPVIVDRRIDCVVVLDPSEPVPGERVIPQAIRFRRAGSKPVYVEGRDAEGHWGSLRPGVLYHALRAAVQLANRSGPLNEVEFSEFAGEVHRLADALDAAVEFPEMADIVQMGRELDGFAAQCDAQLSINVLSDSAPWSGSYVQAVASQDGLLLSRDGTRFVKLDAKQNPVFTLTFEGTNFLRDDLTYKGGHMITLLLDVPVADEDILPWRLMCDYARSLGQRIGARVVDDQRRVLPDASLQAIDERLMTLYARLEQAGLPAGSPAARRLFSS